MQTAHGNNTSGISATCSLTNVPVGAQIIGVVVYSSGGAQTVSATGFSDNASNTYVSQAFAIDSSGAHSACSIWSGTITNGGTITFTGSATTSGTGAIDIGVYQLTGLISTTKISGSTFNSATSPMTVTFAGKFTVGILGDEGSATTFTPSGLATLLNDGVNGGGCLCSTHSTSGSIAFSANTQTGCIAAFS